MGERKIKKVVPDVELRQEEKRTLDLLENFLMKVSLTSEDTLYRGKTKEYKKRFSSWAAKAKGEHLENLCESIISAAATHIVGDIRVDADLPNMFIRGYVAGLRDIRKRIIEASGEIIDNDD